MTLRVALEIDADAQDAVAAINSVAEEAERAQRRMTAAQERETARRTAAAELAARQAAAQAAAAAARQRALLQAVAFQFQDIATQVALGADVIRTVTVQGAQLVGTFGAVGAAIGAALIPLGALAQLMISTAGNAAELGDVTERLRNVTQEVAAPVLDAAGSYDELRESIARLLPVQRDLLELQVQLRAAALRQNLQDAEAAAERTLATVREDLARARDNLLAAATTIQPARPDIEVTERELPEAVQALNERLREQAATIDEVSEQFRRLGEQARASQQPVERLALDLGRALLADERLPQAARARVQEIVDLAAAAIKARGELARAEATLAELRAPGAGRQQFEAGADLAAAVPRKRPAPASARDAERARREAFQADLALSVAAAARGEFDDARSPAARERARGILEEMARQRAEALRDLLSVERELAELRARQQLGPDATRADLELEAERQLAALRREGLELDRASTEEIQKRRQARLEEAAAVERSIELERRAQEIGQDVGAVLADGLRQATIHGRELNDVLSDMARRLEALAFQRIVAEPLISVIGEGAAKIPGLLGIKENAKGNVFYHGEVVPFARGGVVTAPTIFPMSRGIGLMGEAGPEAIMPLRRGPDGRLGVTAFGAGVTVHVQTIDQRGHGAPVDTRVDRGPDGSIRIRQLIRDEVAGLIEGGRLDGPLNRRFGARPLAR